MLGFPQNHSPYHGNNAGNCNQHQVSTWLQVSSIGTPCGPLACSWWCSLAAGYVAGCVAAGQLHQLLQGRASCAGLVAQPLTGVAPSCTQLAAGLEALGLQQAVYAQEHTVDCMTVQLWKPWVLKPGSHLVVVRISVRDVMLEPRVQTGHGKDLLTTVTVLYCDTLASQHQPSWVITMSPKYDPNLPKQQLKAMHHSRPLLKTADCKSQRSACSPSLGPWGLTWLCSGSSAWHRRGQMWPQGSLSPQACWHPPLPTSWANSRGVLMSVMLPWRWQHTCRVRNRYRGHPGVLTQFQMCGRCRAASAGQLL